VPDLNCLTSTVMYKKRLCVRRPDLKNLGIWRKLYEKIIHYIAARDLQKRRFRSLLSKVNSLYKGVHMYDNARWHRRGGVRLWSVGPLDEAREFFTNEKLISQELSDKRISRRGCSSTFSLPRHWAEFPGVGKIIDSMFGKTIASEFIWKIIKLDVKMFCFKFFRKKERKSISDLGIHETRRSRIKRKTILQQNIRCCFLLLFKIYALQETRRNGKFIKRAEYLLLKYLTRLWEAISYVTVEPFMEANIHRINSEVGNNWATFVGWVKFEKRT
jgi:hypothetical protein